MIAIPLTVYNSPMAMRVLLFSRLLYRLTEESMMWLETQGKQDKVAETLKKIAKINKKPLPNRFLQMQVTFKTQLYYISDKWKYRGLIFNPYVLKHKYLSKKKKCIFLKIKIVNNFNNILRYYYRYFPGIFTKTVQNFFAIFAYLMLIVYIQFLTEKNQCFKYVF